MKKAAFSCLTRVQPMCLDTGPTGSATSYLTPAELRKRTPVGSLYRDRSPESSDLLEISVSQITEPEVKVTHLQ